MTKFADLPHPLISLCCSYLSPDDVENVRKKGGCHEKMVKVMATLNFNPYYELLTMRVERILCLSGSQGYNATRAYLIRHSDLIISHKIWNGLIETNDTDLQHYFLDILHSIPDKNDIFSVVKFLINKRASLEVEVYARVKPLFPGEEGGFIWNNTFPELRPPKQSLCQRIMTIIKVLLT